jgi:hypothetical protein
VTSRIARIASTYRPALREQRPDEGAVVSPVRIPKTVQATKASRGQWLIDRSEIFYPGIPLGNGTRKDCQLFWKFLIHQARVPRPAAVVHQSDDRPDVELSQPIAVARLPTTSQRSPDRPVRSPPRARDNVGCGSQAPQIGRDPRSFPSAGASELLEVAIANSVDGAFHTAPQLQPGLLLEYHGS